MFQEFPYKIKDKAQIINEINDLSASGIAFLFVIDYDGKKGYVVPADQIDPEYIQFEFNGVGNSTGFLHQKDNSLFQWEIDPVSFENYQQSFNFVKHQINIGNSFLVNLTKPTAVKTNLTTKEIFHSANARYKLWLKNHFVVLSPEIFIQIENQIISSFPMKGTIDAFENDAEMTILKDEKEKAEHATIVDLIRNDLSIVADEVEVTRYRYVEHIKTNKGELLQVSSEIKGKISEKYIPRYGDLLFELLPAGSVTGAPKPKTMQIIESAEAYNRNFYTGICGYFDGVKLDTAVMIRFLEESPEGLIFKSGGGITSQSDINKEYAELIQKVYVQIS